MTLEGARRNYKTNTGTPEKRKPSKRHEEGKVAKEGATEGGEKFDGYQETCGEEAEVASESQESCPEGVENDHSQETKERSETEEDTGKKSSQRRRKHADEGTLYCTV